MIYAKTQGGLGNFLFQVAATYCAALKNGFDYAIPLEVDNPHYKGQKPYILLGINYCEKLPDLPIYKEPGFTYTEIPPIDNIILDGYFQSWKYFDDYREEILKAFGFKYEKKKNYCSIHLRRGDYEKLQEYHPLVTEGYIFDAMMRIMNMVRDWESVKFLVFSDDIPYCKHLFKSTQFKSFIIEYSEDRTEVEDLELMSCCENNITANSALSWWGAYLNRNPNKIVIHPSRWFGVALNHDTKDLYIPNSVIL